MTTGAEFIRTIQGLGDRRFADWSKAAREAIASGQEPSWSTRWQPVTTSIVDAKTGKTHTLTYYVAPDFQSVGTDEDFTIAPLTPSDAQAVADAKNAILPSRRMVLAIYKQAARRLALSSPTGRPFNLPTSAIDTTEAYIDARKIDRNQYTAPPKTGIITGHRKNVVTGPNLDGSRVAIYGGGGGSGADGVFWQPYSTIHEASYGDYSHAVQPVFRVATLDGVATDLVSVFTDPVLSQLVSDQGAFDPRWPTAGKSVKFGSGGGGGGSGGSPSAKYNDGSKPSALPTLGSDLALGAGVALTAIGLFLAFRSPTT